MGIDLSATMLIGWETSKEVLFDISVKTVTTKSCDHPNPHNLKHCGECGKRYKLKTREQVTERLRPGFLAIFGEDYADKDEVATWGVFDCGELFQSWEGPNGVGVHERLNESEDADPYVWGLIVTSWDPKYETHISSFSFEELEAKRALVAEALSELGLDVPLKDIKVYVWGDMH